MAILTRLRIGISSLFPARSRRRYPRHAARAIAALVFCGLAALPSPGWTQELEYKIKAVFLYNFMHFVQWPASARAAEAEADPMHHIVCILGQNPFDDALEYIRDRESAASLFDIRYNPKNITWTSCTIIFFDKALGKQMDPILAYLKQYPILTVSDAEGFAARGGMIGMMERNNKIRLQINARVFNQAGFTSSQLMELAEVVP